MNSKYLILFFLVFEKGFAFRPRHQIDRQTKSIFSNKKCMETFTPARYLMANKNIRYECPTVSENIMLEQYFPQMEFPINIMEASRPFFYRTGENYAMLGPFSDDVRSSYKCIIDQNKKSIEELKAKYMNDFTFNSINCFDKFCTPENELINEVVPVLDVNADQLLVDKKDDVINEEISQNEPLMDEETELFDPSSESDETIDDDEVIEEGFESNSPGTEEIIEKENIGQFQSWESEQYYYNGEFALEEKSEGDEFDPLVVSEVIIEENSLPASLVESGE